MALVNGDYLHCMDIQKHCKFFSESDQKKKKNWLWSSGEQSRAILALLFKDISCYICLVYLQHQPFTN